MKVSTFRCSAFEQAPGHFWPVKALAKLGFVLDRQKGSHMILFREDPQATVTVPDHRELDRGTLRAILRQAGLSPSELIELL